MIAEAAALSFAQSINLSGFFNAFGANLGGQGSTGSRASGGPASGWTVVGERGPELLNLPRGSHVTNNSASRASGGLGGTGDAVFNTNIDARGADPGLIARLPMILEQRDRRLMSAFKRYNETGVMPI